MFESSSELIVVLDQPARGRGATVGLFSESGSTLTRLMGEYDATAMPLFSNDVRSFSLLQDNGLDQFFKIVVAEPLMVELSNKLLAQNVVTSAYVKPGCTLPVFIDDSSSEEIEILSTGTTPNFSSMQKYLAGGLDGLDAQWSWSQRGGRGEGISVIDIEGAWLLNHEDLSSKEIRLLSVSQSKSPMAIGHGTAVLGILCGNNNQLCLLYTSDAADE